MKNTASYCHRRYIHLEGEIKAAQVRWVYVPDFVGDPNRRYGVGFEQLIDEQYSRRRAHSMLHPTFPVIRRKNVFNFVKQNEGRAALQKPLGQFKEREAVIAADGISLRVRRLHLKQADLQVRGQPTHVFRFSSAWWAVDQNIDARCALLLGAAQISEEQCRFCLQVNKRVAFQLRRWRLFDKGAYQAG